MTLLFHAKFLLNPIVIVVFNAMLTLKIIKPQFENDRN